MIHSKTLEETALWQNYQNIDNSEGRRSGWVKKVYEAAAEYLKDVRQTFQNYTLHDEKHILNVLDAMGGLLGSQISQLTVGEMELLILAACLHDTGMVYTAEDKQNYFTDEDACKKFLREYHPELLGTPADKWQDEIRQWYLRTQHPFRVPEILQKEVWRELFDNCPLEIVPKRCVIAVCQAHGESPVQLQNNRDLNYLPANDVDPLFCALLLRLGDLLDFDDTRAPRVLYSYVACNEKSREEWDKHQASGGFRYPASPARADLPYKARCTNPGVEHAVRDFLDWVDQELGTCMKLQRYCSAGWHQEFAFPRAVGRAEIESDGYMSGDFCLTMDQTQVLKLLTGENLYDNTDVFIRELLQNAIDAVLLRGEMDSAFVPEQSRIDLWEWSDQEGNIWFRVDDEGTGMTLGMLQRYFLKVGNSYYTSKELERDLRDHGRHSAYHSISRFGIGFLSCFLCGEYAEVSTLYFDDDKNRREESAAESYQTIHYGLRLQVTGLCGYYTLKNQSGHHQADGLPGPGGCGAERQRELERNGYRARAGTSVAVRLNPGKLGALNLREAAEHYLCCARVPVYYNNKRIGRTYQETMQAAHELAGETFYELTPKMKEQFDRSFPAVRGQYPRIAVTVAPLDTEEDQILPGISGVLIKYHAHFDKTPEWKIKDQEYEISGNIYTESADVIMELQSLRKNRFEKNVRWEQISKNYSLQEVNALAAEFDKYHSCPRAEDLGTVWQPFDGAESLLKMWEAYCYLSQDTAINFSITACGCPTIASLSFNHQCVKYGLVYQGILAGNFFGYRYHSRDAAIFLLEGRWKPEVNVSRSQISALPLEVLIAIHILSEKYGLNDREVLGSFCGWEERSLRDWREAQSTQLHQAAVKSLKHFFDPLKQELQRPSTVKNDGNLNISGSIYNSISILRCYWFAFCQDKYHMEINYEKGQVLSFFEKEQEELEDSLELFPPMMFCRAASDESRRYLCSELSIIRRGITLDHPFAVWLLDNAVPFHQYYRRQFQQIVESLQNNNAEKVIMVCSRIRSQLMALPEHHGVDIGAFPQLGREDFWSPPDLG